jgi:integrase
VGEEAKAERWVPDRERDVAAARAAGITEGRFTVSSWAERWLATRTNITAGDDRSRLRLHVLPRIGTMMLADVRPRHVRDVILALRAEAKLAPATIRDVSGVLHTMFKAAVIAELIGANPVQLERGVLPKKVDADPTWRHQAIYTRAEIETLISDDRILPDRRVLYALKSLGALRHGEAASLTWGQYDTRAEPLAALNLAHTKSGVPRRMPVHPTLAKVLASWKLFGWRALYGRQPTDADLIVPTRNLTERENAEAQHQLVADLGLLGLRVRAGKKRNRRGHDMRRTFITLARADGARPDILRWCTHGPKPNEMMDLYASFDWPTLCAEVAKLRLEVREGKLVALPIAANAGHSTARNDETAPTQFGAALVQSAQPHASAKEKSRPQRDSKTTSPLANTARLAMFSEGCHRRIPDHGGRNRGES